MIEHVRRHQAHGGERGRCRRMSAWKVVGEGLTHQRRHLRRAAPVCDVQTPLGGSSAALLALAIAALGLVGVEGVLLAGMHRCGVASYRVQASHYFIQAGAVSSGDVVCCSGLHRLVPGLVGGSGMKRSPPVCGPAEPGARSRDVCRYALLRGGSRPGG